MDREEIISQNQGIANQSENGTSVPLNTPALTFDVIGEILAWLPVMVLLRFKTVCKDWKAIIESDNFMFKHYNRSLPCFVWDRHNEEQRSDIMLLASDTYLYLGVYYGMIVEWGRSLHGSGKYRIRNPATRRVIELPDPHEGVFGMFLYRLSSPGDYKLMSLYDDRKEAGNGCQILSLDGSDNPSWRPLSVPNLHELGDRRRWNNKFVLIGQVVHVVILASNAPKLRLHVLSLDIEKECFISISTPHNCLADLNDVHPFQFNGQLAFAEVVKEGLQVYTLDSHDKKLVEKVVWPLLFLKDKPEMLKYEPEMEEKDLYLFAVRGSEEVWFNQSVWKLFIYDTALGRITYLQAHTVMPFRFQMRSYGFPLMPSLFGIKRMGPTLSDTPNRFTQLPRV